MATRDNSVHLRVGIVGCGRVVQTVHLSALTNIHEAFVSAVCDTDETVLDRVATRLGGVRAFTSHDDLVACPDVDVVLIATREHVVPALAAIEAGKHVLVEKPLCFRSEEGRAVQEAAKRSGVTAMLGYMKRYDWCFERFRERVEALEFVRFARVHNFTCSVSKNEPLFDVTVAAGQGGASSMEEWLLMFASHDFSIVRGALGNPEQVEFVEQSGPATLLVGLRCPGGTLCMLELSVDTRYEWFDETFSVYADQTIVTIRFADPFIPFTPSVTWVREASDGGVGKRVETGPFEDAFKREWRHFLDCVVTGRPPRTPLSEGVADAELAAEIASLAEAIRR
jgi:predicted dehydrogenase